MVDPAAARHFGLTAARYSRLRTSGLFGRVRAREQAAVQELAAVKPGSLVLDAGCGDGANLEWLVSRGVRAVGIDVVWPMARICSNHGFEVLVQDIEALGLRPVFDRVLCVGALEFVGDPARALENLAACLAPAGVLVLLFPRRSVLGSLYTVYHRTHGARIHLFSPQEMGALLAQAGLTPPLRWRDCLMSSVCTARAAQGESG